MNESMALPLLLVILASFFQGTLKRVSVLL
jgi:hypothetical protein